jgi:hypothetical protein
MQSNVQHPERTQHTWTLITVNIAWPFKQLFPEHYCSVVAGSPIDISCPVIVSLGLLLSPILSGRVVSWY